MDLFPLVALLAKSFRRQEPVYALIIGAYFTMTLAAGDILCNMFNVEGRILNRRRLAALFTSLDMAFDTEA